MKIGLVSPYDFSVPGGVNSHILQLAAQFRRRGQDVRILAPASNQERLLGDPEHVIVVGRAIAVPVSGSIARIAWNPRLGGRVSRLLREQSFDVVHVHEPMMPWLPVTAVRVSEAVTVGTFHAAREGGSRIYSYSRPLLKRWFRRLDGRIAVSPTAARLVQRYYPGQYDIIPNGIDVERYREAAPFSQYRDGKLNILFVGRLEKRKGAKYLLRAFAGLKREMPDVRLIIVGEGRARRGYETSVRKAGLRDVVFTGLVSEADKVRYLHTADIFCAPATGNESFGIVLAEAMAAGLPIVATNLEGYAHVMTHNVEGLLVPPKDERSLAQALRVLALDPALRAQLAARGRERVRQFDWSRVGQTILSYYERLLYERPARLEDDADLEPIASASTFGDR
jgi:phosphatidylinositol alpha-mannosyltransferase